MEPNAILAINSLDRYNKNQGVGGQLASFSTSLVNQYSKTGEPCNNFQVGGFGALIYGYIKKIQVSQTQLEYNVPTVIPAKNDTLVIRVQELNAPFTIATAEITLPFGYYTPSELAAILQIQLDNSLLDPITPILVEYRSDYNDFIFNVLDSQNYQMWFPDVADLIEYYGTINPEAYLIVLKCYRLLGINIDNSFPSDKQDSKQSAQFLYTPYVDIFSTALTKYQKVKDNTTSASSDSTLIARIFLSGEGTPQNTGGEVQLNVSAEPGIQPIANTNYAYPLGSRPFIVVQDCNTPKVIRWSKDETVYALDFQLRDQYGDLLFTQTGTYGNVGNTNPVYYTEFQMTLMCIEGER